MLITSVQHSVVVDGKEQLKVRVDAERAIYDLKRFENRTRQEHKKRLNKYHSN